MSLIEIIAVVFSLLCVGLAIKRSVWNWPVGIIGILAYLIVFYQIRLYADMILQIFFIAQAIYGLYNWSNSKTADTFIAVSILPNHLRLVTIASIVFITLLWGLALQNYTDASLPYIDAFAATTSFIANWLMARKKIENWILWITADAVYIGLFLYKGLYLSSGIYSVFLVMAIAGLIEWNKKLVLKKVSL